ncbi:cytidylate kinase [Flavobacteria bacterium MS024-3C]|jgi:cytidylate kinase|nr:cytidylate kinase [Flavobacteria bacterium MS024-3C]KRO81122.1 MAG: cytidylate kinase [Polaribacter sp. BACL8 MAG-120531-bin13]KRP14436.1 MAG: cytidylate kinase [Polaribacter sp. BACL8 MAG-120419-bin8]MBT4839111.1 (d)CMP kinase [Flavobacteriaceae bacterium]NQV62980.1 (d)CMP kinase [Cryomorphaceae bacterium]|tara:strand:- start:12798 stop:13487 length:690 start_codon:yes stop_codon:yes gene_type:complete
MKKITIAIDGFSSTGKSTIAKKLAKSLGYIYVDSGAMYRGVTYFAMQQGFIKDGILDKTALVNSLDQIDLQFKFVAGQQDAAMFLNGANIEKPIRTLAVSQQVSPVATVPEVREKLVALQQAMGIQKGVVMDGRDIGTVVFPEAELKLYLTASADTRAHRRYKELIDRGDKVHFDAVLKNVQERDYIDSHRATSPLKKAEGAVEIDNSDMGLEEQFERILSHANALIAF